MISRLQLEQHKAHKNNIQIRGGSAENIFERVKGRVQPAQDSI